MTKEQDHKYKQEKRTQSKSESEDLKNETVKE